MIEQWLTYADDLIRKITDFFESCIENVEAVIAAIRASFTRPGASMTAKLSKSNGSKKHKYPRQLSGKDSLDFFKMKKKKPKPRSIACVATLQTIVMI